jgi:hypothetical protein
MWISIICLSWVKQAGGNPPMVERVTAARSLDNKLKSLRRRQS